MKSIKNGLLFGGLIVLMGVVLVCDIIFGSVRLPLEALWSDDILYREIIYNFRLPKALTAVITGAAISVAGLIMQTLFRNPLAGPYVLGVSSGASLGVAVYLLAGGLLPVALTQSGWGLVIAAITGAVLVLLLVLAVSLHVRQAVSLLIIGIMFGQIAGSLVTILQNSSNPDSLKLFVVWTFGSLSAVGWNYMQVMLLLITVGLTIVFAIQKSLNGLLLGENYAQGLGINITRTRFLIIVAVALLAGTTTAFTGPIAFIGMAVPHLARGLFRTSDHSITIPGTMLCGAILLLLCDLATQLPADGYTLPINAISALVGAPIIIWIILKNKRTIEN
ncbi:MAG TPA: iron ABC transporter permease [Paludibacteraceae bacterium]|jgi:iron complex transport system permease protein|nr:iron ABC transporter permease [Paludibacteraceae bacterium]HOO23499.1 iron ABC transporter permease [Paludibacteraceae bacterium]HPD27150.1 iron ABC transporter permease [Paludibacteraceae bacterium]HPW96542.1 iron ABC transporter permease [Paludibacteraceae bacterium]HQC05142.1 iron ABC transporter permease [Paludibacteraceae bacterium]